LLPQSFEFAEFRVYWRNFCAGSTEAIGIEPADEEGSFDDAAKVFDTICAHTRQALRQSKDALSSIHQTVLPKSQLPATTEALAGVFAPGSTTMANYARAQMVGGSETTLILLRGNGITGDFAKALAGFPKNSGGKPAITDAMQKEAAALSKKMVTMLEQRAAAVAQRAARNARARSESVSDV